ncbi:MAG TPA: TIM barrel protein [Candidatus Bathyarchaeia archaeon]|nr:TIM barrel protein [Candidatus Bathyarchaeia archaeon]
MGKEKERSVVFAGQNKYWGTVEEATQFWTDIGLSHLMIKRATDTRLLDDHGRLIETDFEKLSKLQEKYQVDYHLHLYNLIFDGVFMSPALERAQPVFREILENVDRAIGRYRLYPLITIHLPKYADPEYNFGLSEEAAFQASRNFFQTLDLESEVALETMHDPFRNPGHALFGYQADHFKTYIQSKNFGLCIDIGHLVMAQEPIHRFLELPYPLLCVHLNGNDGSSDQHLLPTEDNVGDCSSVVQVLRNCRGPIVFEVRKYAYSKEQVQDCLRFWSEAVKKSS